MDSTKSPVLTLDEAAAYIGRTPKGLRGLRHRRTAPPGFRAGGRVLFRIEALDAWLDEHESQDSRSNRGLDPTLRAPEPRRAPRRQPAAA
ncbi:helix-turn-helix domain-containing protein [Kitasatospora sp. NPDC054939]